MNLTFEVEDFYHKRRQNSKDVWLKNLKGNSYYNKSGFGHWSWSNIEKNAFESIHLRYRRLSFKELQRFCAWSQSVEILQYLSEY